MSEMVAVLGLVRGFKSIAPAQNSIFEVDYTITSEPQTSVVFACDGTGATSL